MDLKPGNVVFEDSTLNKIILLDFGASKIERRNRSNRTDVLAMSY